MRVRLLAVGLSAGLFAVSMVPAVTASAGMRKAKAQTVGTDVAGDWGADIAPNLAPLGDVLGQDLVKAEIATEGSDTVNFIIKLTSLPPSGGWPEVTRYTWNLEVDGELIELDGKFTNYSRGACDPSSGQCPPPRDPGLQPFFVRGECEVVETVRICRELGTVQAKFDVASASITIPVPLELISAQPGSKISGGDNHYGGSISATPSAYFSTDGLPLDILDVTRTFVVPRGKRR